MCHFVNSIDFQSRLSREREQALLAQRSLEERYDEERRSVVAEHKRETQSLNTKVDELQRQNRELSEKLMTLTHTEQRTSQRLQTSKQELEETSVCSRVAMSCLQMFMFGCGPE